MTEPTDETIQAVLDKLTRTYCVNMNATAIQIGAQGIGLPLAISMIATAALDAVIALRRTAEMHGDATGGDAFTRKMFEAAIALPIQIFDRGTDGEFRPVTTTH